METFYDGKTPRISPKIGSLCDGGCACVPPNASYSVFEAGGYVTFGGISVRNGSYHRK